MAIAMRVIFFFLLLTSPFLLQVVRCDGSDSSVEVADVDDGGDGFDIGDNDVVSNYDGDSSYTAAPGVDTVCVFPKNSARLIAAGEETELLVGINNGGESSLNVVGVKASIHLPYDHRMLVQNLTGQAFRNASVPISVQATFPYIFAVHKYLQPGTFDLVGTIIYEIDQNLHQSTFYNGTIEVIEASTFLSIESVFLVSLGIALLGLAGLWVHGQVQRLSKKTKKTPKVEVGTKTVDASMDEWLEGTAYAQSMSNKSKKKK